MTEKPGQRLPVVARVTCCCQARTAIASGYRRQFAVSERVRSLRQVKNDGTYPHKDIGEIVVHDGDTGYVRERWSFLGTIYYTVEFVDRAVVVIMSGRELVPADHPAA